MAAHRRGRAAVTAVVRQGAASLPMAAPVGRETGTMSPSMSAIPLAGEHFGMAVVYLVAGAVGLLWIAPDLARGAYTEPRVAGVVHLFTLGWITMTIFGALYQLLPVALGAPIRSPRLGHASFWTFAPGAGLFAAGVGATSPILRHVGITLVGTGVVLAVSNVASTLPRARARDVIWAAIALAITFLTSTLTLGAILLHNLQTGFIASARLRVLAIHLHVAIVGWALVMMVGVSHRLLPMFLLARGADTRWTKRALVFLTTGVPTLATGILVQQTVASWAGVGLLELGIACFLRQAYAFYRVRAKRSLDIGMRFAATALGFLSVSALLGPAVLAVGRGHARLDTAYVAIGLLGGIVLYIIGLFYKIVPLLAWVARYRGHMGKRRVPTVAEMFSSRAALVQLGAMGSGITLLGVGIGFGSERVVRCGALLFLAGVLLFVSQLVRVAFGGAR
jgi:hypothetical protein